MARPPLVWRDRNPSTERGISVSTRTGLQAIVDRAWRVVFAKAYAAEAAAETRRAARCEAANEPRIGAPDASDTTVVVASPSFTASASLAADQHAPSWNPDATPSREPLAANLLQNVLNVAARKFNRADPRPHPATFARDPHFMAPHNDVEGWDAENRHDEDLAIPVLRKRASR